MSDARDRDDARKWREHVARRGPVDQPRLYRVRLFDAGREVLAGHTYPVVLDLTHGAPVEDANRKLDELLRSMLRTAGVRDPQRARSYYLDVREWGTGQELFLWPVTWSDAP